MLVVIQRHLLVVLVVAVLVKLVLAELLLIMVVMVVMERHTLFLVQPHTTLVAVEVVVLEALQ